MPKRYHRLLLFVIVFIGARLIVPPINNTDYLVSISALRSVIIGQTTYGSGYLMPPWSFIFLLPISGQIINVWLALTIALFTAAIVDLGGWSALPLLLHPGLITMVASSNPEWLLVGSGLWLYYRGGNRGWKRGLAWLLLSCKPQTTFIFLIFDGISAFRQRDWRAFTLSGSVVVVMLALFPTYLPNFNPDVGAGATIFYAYGVPSALLATLIVLAIRWTRRSDWATIGLLLAPIWAPYTHDSLDKKAEKGIWRAKER
jgi:hypothetical protein